ncbi:MAG: hypothetical protein QG635_2390, partial [Bacteroidota bacterium]|nr:hypothetical protein [Bacteroidota bacterium]
MKRNIVLITIFLAIFLIIFKISQAQELSDRRQITVTGEADVYAVPDLVSFVVGVETW